MATRDERDELDCYVDGELDAMRAREAERRLASDPASRARVDSILALRIMLRAEAARDDVPPLLRARVARTAGRANNFATHSWMSLAASFVIGAGLAGAIALSALSPRDEPIADALVNGHIRSLLAAQPIDIASSERHTVKPWLSHKVAQSPEVFDLATEGFPLRGARVDVVNREPVATLVYARGAHLVSVTAIAGKLRLPASAETNGYRVQSWMEGGLAYVAVSDIPASELSDFAKAFRHAIAAR